MIAVGLALVLRSVATVRPRPETRQAWPPDTSQPTSAAASFAAQAYLLQSQRAAAMAGISAEMPAGLAGSQSGGVAGAPAAASAVPWPGTAASHWPGSPAGGMPVVPGTVAHTPAHGVPAAQGMQYYTPAAGIPVVPGTVAHTPAHGMPSAQYRTHPARGIPAVSSTEPPAEYGPVTFEMQALYSAPPDEQARRAAR